MAPAKSISPSFCSQLRDSHAAPSASRSPANQCAEPSPRLSAMLCVNPGTRAMTRTPATTAHSPASRTLHHCSGAGSSSVRAASSLAIRSFAGVVSSSLGSRNAAASMSVIHAHRHSTPTTETRQAPSARNRPKVLRGTPAQTRHRHGAQRFP